MAVISVAVERAGVGKMLRLIKHLITPGWWTRRPFGGAVLARIEAVIAQSEQQHCGELRIAIEADLDLRALLRGVTPRQRAIGMFSQMRVWDTAQNSGVLIYVQLIDRDIEIVADRGINARVAQAEWDAICARMEAAFRQSQFEAGVTAGLRDITALLTRHFPARAENPDELPNRPVLL